MFFITLVIFKTPTRLINKREIVFVGSKADKELQLIVGNKRLVKDVRKLSPAQQTSQLEAYHKTVCHFAPKFHHFFYDAMNAR